MIRLFLLKGDWLAWVCVCVCVRERDWVSVCVGVCVGVGRAKEKSEGALVSQKKRKTTLL